MKEDIEFKIIEIKKGGTDRFIVKIKHKLFSQDEIKFKEEIFNFKNIDLVEDAFLDIIRNKLKKRYVETVEFPKKLEGKTFYINKRS